MVTRIGRRRKLHLYISEWMDHLGLTDEMVAGRLDTSRTTVWRWRTQQHRLTPDKIAQLADAIDVEPEQLFRLPERPSMDAIAKDAPQAVYDALVDHVRRITKAH